MILRKIPSRAFFKILQIIIGSFENEALENENRSTKHPKLESEAPKTPIIITHNLVEFS